MPENNAMGFPTDVVLSDSELASRDATREDIRRIFDCAGGNWKLRREMGVMNNNCTVAIRAAKRRSRGVGGDYSGLPISEDV